MLNFVSEGARAGLILTQPMRVEEQWVDYNGHLNMAYYNVLFDRAADIVFAEFGLGPDYLKQTNASFFTLEVHVTYLREIHAGDMVETTFRAIGFDEKRIHVFQELYHCGEGFLSATSEGMLMHVDMALKKSSPFPSEVSARIKACHDRQANLPPPKQLGHVIGLPPKKA